MEAALVVYFISQLDAWKASLDLACFVIPFFTVMLLVVIYGMMYEGNRKIPKWQIVVPCILWVFVLCLDFVLPNKKTAEYMAGAYGVQYVVQSHTGQQVLDKSGKIVNNVLDLAIQKTTPSK